jgi:dTDP-4-dehydrorhamnose 3,5-epimerase-like enzyme
MGTAIHSSTPGTSRGLHYHASTQPSRAIVLQRDNQIHTMIEDSTRGTDILIDQYKIDQGWQINKKSEQSIASMRRSGALTKQAFLPPLDECGR